MTTTSKRVKKQFSSKFSFFLTKHTVCIYSKRINNSSKLTIGNVKDRKHLRKCFFFSLFQHRDIDLFELDNKGEGQ